MPQSETTAPILYVALALTAAVIALLALQNLTRPDHASARDDQVLYYAEISTSTLPVGRAAASVPGDVRVPILVYHVVRPAYPDDSAAVRNLAQTPEVFDAQMQHLVSAGYHPISFTDLENHFKDSVPLPHKPVIISFDDGWRSQFEYAFPILQKYGISATFFIFTNSIGKREFLSWDNLKTLRDAGMPIGSHSRSHPYLTTMVSPTALSAEIVESKRILEEGLGISINQFAYPFGQFTPAIAAQVKEAGYTSARGDYYSGDQSRALLYGLSATNVPTTIEKFVRMFP